MKTIFPSKKPQIFKGNAEQNWLGLIRPKVDGFNPTADSKFFFLYNNYIRICHFRSFPIFEKTYSSFSLYIIRQKS